MLMQNGAVNEVRAKGMVRRWLRYGWLVVLLSVAAGTQAQVGDNEGAVAQAEVATSADPAVAEVGTSESKARGKTLFWVVLVLALLFVVGSATALNALGGRQHQPLNENERKQ